MMKPRFNTSREIYNRILWDDQFNERAFFIGYRDRMSPTGRREKTLIEWGTSEIPWSRVYYIRCGEEKVWDREERIDLFESGNLPPEAFAQSNQHAEQRDDVFDKPVYHHTGAGWESLVDDLTSQAFNSLSVVTFNVLTDRFKPEQLYSEERWTWLIHQLPGLEADVILLQEVTPRFLEKLLRKRAFFEYYLSTAPHGLHLKNTGNVILSKYPFHLREWKYSEAKQFPIATFMLNGERIQIANVHLSSNQNKQAPAVRKEQLTQLFNLLASQGGTYLVGGDFNMREDETPTSYSTAKVDDVWTELHPQETGWTYDPAHNPLAKLLSLTGKPGRLDRILLHSEQATWQARKAILAFDQPMKNEAGKLFASDHFGLLTTLGYQEPAPKVKKAVSKAFEQAPTYQSAVVWIPPKGVWPAIQAIRKKFDAKYERWMPHVTLVYGFIPEADFAEVLDTLSAGLKQVQPFSTELAGYGTFEHRSSTTAWLKPEGADAQWQGLQQLLQTPFVHCTEQTDRNGGFTPHLSVGQFASVQEALSALPQWTNKTAPVGEIALISRSKDGPFKVRYTIALGSGQVRAVEVADDQVLHHHLKQAMPRPTEEEQDQLIFIQELMAEACSSVLGHPARLYPIGSVALGTNVAGGDLDLVCPIPEHLGIEDTLRAIATELEGLVSALHLVVDAQVPALRCVLSGIAVDLLLVRNPQYHIPLTEIMERDYRSFDQVSWMALGGVLEAENLKRLVSAKGSFDLFQDLVRLVKLWAKRRGLAGNAFGFLGSYSWTVLCAWVCVRQGQQSTDLSSLFNAFFKQVHQHDWSNPVALVEREKAYKVSAVRDRMPIMTTVHPQFNSARNITRSTAHIIQQELERAHRLTGKDVVDWEHLLEPTEPLPGVSISVYAQGEVLRKASGWLEGHAITLVIALEKVVPVVHPWPSLMAIEGGVRLQLGIDAEPAVVKAPVDSFVDQLKEAFGSTINVVVNA